MQKISKKGVLDLDTTGVGKVILWGIVQNSKFDHAYKWYLHKAESVLGNVKSKILWDFSVQTNNLILCRRPDLVIVYKNR